METRLIWVCNQCRCSFVHMSSVWSLCCTTRKDQLLYCRYRVVDLVPSTMVLVGLLPVLLWPWRDWVVDIRHMRVLIARDKHWIVVEAALKGSIQSPGSNLPRCLCLAKCLDWYPTYARICHSYWRDRSITPHHQRRLL